MPSLEAAGLPEDLLFTGKFEEEFGIALGSAPPGTTERQRWLQVELEPKFAPFQRVTLMLAHPSRRVYRISATATLRTDGRCRAALEPLRARLEKAFGITLQPENYAGVRRHVGWFGRRGEYARFIACDGDLLSVTVMDLARESGCDPVELDRAPMPDPPPGLLARFPGAQSWDGTEVDATLGVLQARAEQLYRERLREIPCLGLRVSLFAIVDGSGRVQALESVHAGDTPLVSAIEKEVTATTFPRFEGDTPRLVIFRLTFTPVPPR